LCAGRVVDVVLRRAAAVCAALAILCGVQATSALAAARWVPPAQLTWYWQLTGTLKVEPVQATDLDGFDTGAATVADFHQLGQHTICYIDVGTWENWRSDASVFPAAVLGDANGWPGERWLDIRQLSVLEPIMTARFQICAQKGFDAVEPDNMDGFENSTGFPISAAQQLSYDEWVAQEVHSLGMAVLQKNDPDQAAQLEPYFDGVLAEQCNQYAECSSYQPYLAASKPVLNAEYQSSLYPSFCSSDETAGIMGALYAPALDGGVYQPCFGPSTTTPSRPPIAGSPPTTRSSRPALDKVAPKVGIGRGGLKARGDVVAVSLSCPHGQSYCDGRLELETMARFALSKSSGRGRVRAPLLLGAGRFHILGGSSALVKVELSKPVLRKLGRRNPIRVRVQVTARDAAERRRRAALTTELNVRSSRTGRQAAGH
jgi:hypothetical protein